jgi:hypothetical protein
MNAVRERMWTLAGALLVALFAGLMALAVNVGILRAAGDPRGPGRLGSSAASIRVADIAPALAGRPMRPSAPVPEDD